MDTKRRKPNWMERELEALAEAVAPKNGLLRGKFWPSLTSERKQSIWIEIVNQVNSITMVNRTGEEIKKKWGDMQSLTKKKESERRRSMKVTGGGPAIDMFYKSWENLVLQSLSEVAIEGISCGVDTAESESVKECSSTLSQSAIIPNLVSDEPSTQGNNASCRKKLKSLDISLGVENECEKNQSLPSTSWDKQQTKGQKRGVHSGEASVQEQFLLFEKEKMEKVEESREKNLLIMNEMLQLQRRRTAAIEQIASSDSKASPPLSLSPIIQFY
ncbi:myb-related transcription factor, partner of profilin-like [Mizuhopecten yessoensis]|uniref:myb-related transcription factor, partner of profilin-like n=1 Tax=Mizuhopecten yessoensis TaxID=6573 RepID=UPI000B458000|nr:myb-related transcription factor, partner of profilin-like [Mizuhopecten yessoensis]